ncbi:MAG: thymidine phosphorylase, partial [Lysobacterales bacterium CG17_big_fil_post_rev_8_21_14_2_50_64_11]
AIQSGQPLAVVYARDDSAAQQAAAAVQAAFVIGDSAPTARPLIYRSVPA